MGSTAIPVLSRVEARVLSCPLASVPWCWCLFGSVPKRRRYLPWVISHDQVYHMPMDANAPIVVHCLYLQHQVSTYHNQLHQGRTSLLIETTQALQEVPQRRHAWLLRAQTRAPTKLVAPISNHEHYRQPRNPITIFRGRQSMKTMTGVMHPHTRKHFEGQPVEDNSFHFRYLVSVSRWLVSQIHQCLEESLRIILEKGKWNKAGGRHACISVCTDISFKSHNDQIWNGLKWHKSHILWIEVRNMSDLGCLHFWYDWA